MSGQALGLDHVGIVGPDLAALAATFADLGFTVTPRAEHEGGRTGNHCVMLHESYLELVSTLPGGTSATLARFLARYAGIHIIALRINLTPPCLARLERAGFPGLRPSETHRPLDGTRRDSPMVGFSLVTPPDPPEGRVHLIRHLTPELLWQPTMMAHPNHAVRLAAIEMVVAEPAVTASWFSRVADRPVTPDPAGGFALELPEGRIRMRAPVGDETVTPPWIRGVTLLTDDGNMAIIGILSRAGIAYHNDQEAVITRVDDLILRFQPMTAGSDR